MATVSEQGTIRNIIRGVNDIPFHNLLFEIIDNIQHSKSRQIFIDFNTRERCFIIGYEKEGLPEQIDNMVRWNTTSGIHSSDNMATCGIGLRYFEYALRGDHKHITYQTDANKKRTYYSSNAKSDIIYNAAYDQNVSETAFAECINKNTHRLTEDDEVTHSIEELFNNTDDVYPFAPQLLIISKKVSNDKLIDFLNDEDNVTNIKKELMNKYFHEIKNHSLAIYLRFPQHTNFNIVEAKDNHDIIGLTDHVGQFDITIMEMVEMIPVYKLQKGDLILKIKNKLFQINKNGSSMIRKEIVIDENKYIPYLNFQQYNVPESLQDTNIVGKSMELANCGIYLKIGGKLISSHPVHSSITTRNLYGCRRYRGILSIPQEHAADIKRKLKLSGLKAEYRMSIELETIVKQAAIIYKNYNTCDDTNKDDNPSTYTVVKSSNQKTVQTEKPGIMYILCVGENFYKLGYKGGNERSSIFGYYSDKEYSIVKKDFPDERIYEKEDMYFQFIPSYDFKNARSLEQQMKEFMLEHPDIVTYDHKKGESIREYFHCDRTIIEEVISFLRSNIIRK